MNNKYKFTDFPEGIQKVIVKYWDTLNVESVDQMNYAYKIEVWLIPLYALKETGFSEEEINNYKVLMFPYIYGNNVDVK